MLHVIWNLGQGGAQKYLLDLLRQQYGEFSSRVLVLSGPGPLSDEVKSVCEAVDYIHMRGGSDVRAFFQLVNYLRRFSPTVIHSHSNNTLFNVALHFQLSPVVYTEHGGRLLEHARPAKLLYTLLSRPIKKYIAISNYMRDVMIAENPSNRDKITVVYNGVDIDNIKDNAVTDKLYHSELDDVNGDVVGFVGRLVRQKGVDYFIETAVRLLEKGVKATFVVVGDGPLLTELMATVEQRGFKDRIIFLGYRKDAVSIMRRFDIMLFTSRSDAFGLVLTEAMASGVTVVAMDQTGVVSEIIRDDVDGCVVGGANIEMAADVIQELLEKPQLRSRLADSARKRAEEQFSMRVNAQRVAEIYLSLAHGEADTAKNLQ